VECPESVEAAKVVSADQETVQMGKRVELYLTQVRIAERMCWKEEVLVDRADGITDAGSPSRRPLANTDVMRIC